MSAPDDLQQQIDVAEVAAVMERDPLSKALWELAQCKVMLAKQAAANQLLRDRVDELEARERTDQAERK